MREFKITIDGNEIEVMAKKPTNADYNDAERVRAKKVAELIRSSKDEPILSRVQLDKFLKDQEIWTDEDEDKFVEMQKFIQDGEAKLRKGGIKLSEAREIAINVYFKRFEMVDLMAKRQVFDDATLEAQADQAQRDYLIFCSLHTKDGEKLFENIDEFYEFKETDEYYIAINQTSPILYGETETFEKQLPEYQWLKKYNFIDEDANFVDRKTGERVDRFGKAINQTVDIKVQDTTEEPFIDDYEEVDTPKQTKKSTRKKKQSNSK